jgi:glycosyltransferase involved in cell wall biosynthesis
MKVLLVSSSSGSAGGGEIYLQYLALGLSRLGHRVFVLCSADSAMDKLAENLDRFSEVRRLELRNTYRRLTRSLGAALDFGQQRRLRLAFQRLCPDITHINQQVAEDGLDLILAAQSSGVPFLSTIHIAQSAEALGARLGKLRDLVTSKVLRRVNAVHITVADCARSIVLSRFGFLDPRQIRVVANGVPFTHGNGTTRNDVRARWGVSSGEVVLGTVGRLDAQKQPTFALQVMATLRQKGLPIRYVWVGDGLMRKIFEEQAQRLGIAGYVNLEGWRDDVADCLQGFDIFVMPSKFEGMPLALMEAMAAGLCCCVSDVDGMTEMIEHGLSGYLCATGDLRNWCEQLEALVVRPETRVTMGNRAQMVARRRFSIENMARNTAKIYEEVVSLQTGPVAVAR